MVATRKLSDEEVILIRQSSEKLQALALAYGVSEHTIWSVQNYRTYKDVTGARVRLAGRRQQTTTKLRHGSHRLLISFGYEDDYLIREVFGAGGREGEDMRTILRDACVLLSLLWQTGMSLEDTWLSLGRGDEEQTRPMSLLGAINLAAIQCQAALLAARDDAVTTKENAT